MLDDALGRAMSEIRKELDSLRAELEGALATILPATNPRSSDSMVRESQETLSRLEAERPQCASLKQTYPESHEAYRSVVSAFATSADGEVRHLQDSLKELTRRRAAIQSLRSRLGKEGMKIELVQRLMPPESGTGSPLLTLQTRFEELHRSYRDKSGRIDERERNLERVAKETESRLADASTIANRLKELQKDTHDRETVMTDIPYPSGGSWGDEPRIVPKPSVVRCRICGFEEEPL